jgi:NAD(P)-dependent dehydrogenase (short-subunit alcohol dehydrogenase family)
MTPSSQENLLAAPVVLITGALTGVGRATAFAFAREGYRIVVTGRREEAGESLGAELRALGNEAVFFRVDVRVEAEVQLAVEKTIEHFGRLDVAVNNAGTEGQSGAIADLCVENYEDMFAVNVLGTFLSIKHEMRAMSAQGSGSIVNISSIAGRIGFAYASLYTASKHAVEGLTKSAALEGAALGIRVNAVAPGPVATGMLNRFTGSEAATATFLTQIPARRAAAPEEIARTILFLGSDKANFLTGQCVAVDGGFTAQ